MIGTASMTSMGDDEFKDYVGSVTQKGMVTIPNEVRSRFNIKPKGKIIFRATEDTLEIKPIMALEDARGSVAPLALPKDWKQIREEVRGERVNRYQTKMNS